MTTEIQILDERTVLGKEFKVYGTLESPLFLAKDVAHWIGHTDLSRMANLVDAEEKLKRTLYVSGQNREVWFFTEDGLYEVLMQSRKPIAKEFKKEVKAILKLIRKHGAYMTTEVIEKTLTNPDFIIKLASQLKGEQEKVAELTEYIETQRAGHCLDIKETRKEVGLKSVNTTVLSRELKKVLSRLSGRKIMADDWLYKKATFSLFKKYRVVKWEDIPVDFYTRVLADILELEDVDYMDFGYLSDTEFNAMLKDTVERA